MFPVSDMFLDKIYDDNNVFDIELVINHSKGELVLTDEDIVQGSLVISEGTQSSEEFSIGGVVANDIKFEMVRKPEYDNINFMGARIEGRISMMVREEIDAHFVQSSQPSKMLGFEPEYEDVPLGKFNIDVVNKNRTTIGIKGLDDMITLTKSYSESKLSYPTTLYQIYTNICHLGELSIGSSSFPNSDYIVDTRPDDDLSLREVLSYVAELAGGFAKVDRYGRLEIKWYEETGLEYTPDTRFSFTPSDDEVSIKGILYTIESEEEDVEDETFLIGEETYAIDLSDNPLVGDNIPYLLRNIYNNVKDTKFTPYDCQVVGNPALEAGDIITHTSVEGNVYNTLITKRSFKYRGKDNLTGVGLPDVSKGFRGTTDSRLNIIRNKIDKELGSKITDLEKAQLNATELMANMLGGYIIVDDEDGIIYIADSENLADATKIWKWGTGGFGYSDNGGKTWETAITADGSIVAEIVSAGIITANMVRTGLLESEDGETWINLDNGSFNFKNNFIWDGLDNKIKFGNQVEMGWGNIIGNDDVLEKNDEVDTEYLTNISKNAITTEFIKTLNLEVGNEIKMGTNATISWDNVDGKSDVLERENYRDNLYLTNITKNTIETEEIYAENITVSSANIDGTISANQIATDIAQVASTVSIGSSNVGGEILLYGRGGRNGNVISGDRRELSIRSWDNDVSIHAWNDINLYASNKLNIGLTDKVEIRATNSIDIYCDDSIELGRYVYVGSSINEDNRVATWGDMDDTEAYVDRQLEDAVKVYGSSRAGHINVTSSGIVVRDSSGSFLGNIFYDK